MEVFNILHGYGNGDRNIKSKTGKITMEHDFALAKEQSRLCARTFHHMTIN